MASKSTYTFNIEKLGASLASEYIGHKGQLFIDPEDKKLRISNGVTPGGIVLFSPQI